jgi:hypothetical protein
MKCIGIFYIIGITVSLYGTSTLPAKAQYQSNSGNTDSQNAAIQQKIDDDYKAAVIASLEFKLIIVGIVIILITILCHIYFGRTRAPVLPLQAPLKSAIRKVESPQTPSPQLIVSQPPPRLPNPPTPPKPRGPVITYVRMNHLNKL